MKQTTFLRYFLAQDRAFVG